MNTENKSDPVASAAGSEGYTWIISYGKQWDTLMVHTTVFEDEARAIARKAIDAGMHHINLCRSLNPKPREEGCSICRKMVSDWVDPDWAGGRICRECETIHEPADIARAKSMYSQNK